MSQFCRPDADIAQSGGWVPLPADTVLWDVMDEVSPNDGDYAWHNAIVVGEYFTISIAPPGAPPGSGGIGDVTFRIRAAKIDGAKNPQLRVRLYEGVALRGTFFCLPSTSTYITYSDTNTVAISDFSDLRIEVYCSGIMGGGKAPDPAVSWAEVEVPDPIYYKLEGVTKDKDGNTLGSCHCFLCKNNLDGSASYIAYDLSDGSGNYSFTGLTNNDAQYFVISWKDDSPHVFDTTGQVLQPVAE